MKSIFLALCLTFTTVAAYGSSCTEVKGGIVTVRDSLLGMLKDKSKRTPEQKKLVADSCEKVTNAIAGLPHSPASNDKFEEMKKIWNDFKKVREEQVVPMIEQGKDAEAEKLATGEQKDRLMKIISMCDQIK